FKHTDVYRVARLAVSRVFRANLPEVLPRSNARLGAVTDQWEGAELCLDFAKPKLNGVISIAFDGLHLRDIARPGLNDGYGHNRAFFVVNAGHSDFFSEQCRRHGLALLGDTNTPTATRGPLGLTGSWMNPTVRKIKKPLKAGAIGSNQALILTKTPAGTTRRFN